MMHHKKNGFSLLEVMLAMGLALTAMLATAELTRVSDNSLARGNAIDDRNFLASIIRETLKYETSCSAALTGSGINRSGINNNRILSGNLEIELNLPGTLGDSTPADDIIRAGVDYKGITISSLKIVNAVPLPGAGNDYFAQVELTARSKNQVLTKEMKPRVIGSFFFTRSGARISQCITTSTPEPTPLCVEMGCTWDPMATPSCTCPSTKLTCAPTQFLVGANADGSPICSSLTASCPAGQYIKSVGLGGGTCAPPP